MESSKFDSNDMEMLKQMFKSVLEEPDKNRITIDYAWEAIETEMDIQGLAARTLKDYNYHFFKMCEINNYRYVDEITREGFIRYVKGSTDVQAVTKNNRLKSVKPVLNRLHDRGWIKENFWKDLRVKVSQKVKEGATQEDVFALLSMLDLTNYSEFRDACAILLMWETGVRVGTVGRLTEDMIDYHNNLIHFEGSTMKNYKTLSLPISNELANMLSYLADATAEMLKELGKETGPLFVTTYGNSVCNTTNNNTISKRLSEYAEEFGLKHITAHDIRRGFGKRLYKQGVQLPVISRALNHSSLNVTTKYLHIENEEVIEELRAANNLK